MTAEAGAPGAAVAAEARGAGPTEAGCGGTAGDGSGSGDSVRRERFRRRESECRSSVAAPVFLPLRWRQLYIYWTAFVHGPTFLRSVIRTHFATWGENPCTAWQSKVAYPERSRAADRRPWQIPSSQVVAIMSANSSKQPRTASDQPYNTTNSTVSTHLVSGGRRRAAEGMFACIYSCLRVVRYTNIPLTILPWYGNMPVYTCIYGLIAKTLGKRIYI